jgi:type I restriction enzyme S subunit
MSATNTANVLLAEIVKPRRQKTNPAHHPNLDYIGLEHVEAHSMRLLGTVPATQMKSAANKFFAGDVLYSRLRPYLNKIWRADRDGLCSSEFIVMPGNDLVDADFLQYRLNAHDFVSFASHLNAGDRPRVDFEQIGAFSIELPTEIQQQQRIVAEIEKQFTRLDAGVAALKRAQANLKRYRAAVLKAACEGKLVPTEANWKQTKLGEVLLGIEAGRSFKCEERPPKPDEVGVVKVSAVTWGTYNEMESKTCLDADRMEERFFVQPNDFLFSRANTIELIGACVIAKKITLRVMLSDKILRFRFSEEVNPGWILYWLRSQFGRREIERLATGNQMSMRNIGQDRIRQIAIKLPPLAEQHRIVVEVERRLSVIEEMEAAVSANLRRAARLRQAVLQRAFSGDLPS